MFVVMYITLHKELQCSYNELLYVAAYKELVVVCYCVQETVRQRSYCMLPRTRNCFDEVLYVTAYKELVLTVC